ncbi:MAG: GNAT family N-acetyltransferase [Armatimonadota bacterium]|nr:GNAT family N-acetyltransferase [Armatimonadota bacterium]MDR7422017.1 GNAT family N-acetyltransferase [Armatimonadota bacterium]MDR7454154.1 GNAT family N-acetyltransferase [Armatimonadota bacterium]MDR7455717.1 GNAT family N-acetyltransferase [Armatimonadota bacterium]MDR7496962.1 GNAT family N-acetyltransferase [Armatimonadota bacterium]
MRQSTPVNQRGPSAQPEIAAATAADVEAIRALLVASGLAADRVADRLDGFLVVREGGRVVACACLDDHGEAGLLRSVAVAPERRGSGLARALVAALLARARRRGHVAVYLLTSTAEGYFTRFGFRPVERARVRPAVLTSDQFAERGGCTTSTVMVLEFAHHPDHPEGGTGR